MIQDILQEIRPYDVLILTTVCNDNGEASGFDDDMLIVKKDDDGKVKALFSFSFDTAEFTSVNFYVYDGEDKITEVEREEGFVGYCQARRATHYERMVIGREIREHQTYVEHFSKVKELPDVDELIQCLYEEPMTIIFEDYV